MLFIILGISCWALATAVMVGFCLKAWLRQQLKVAYNEGYNDRFIEERYWQHEKDKAKQEELYELFGDLSTTLSELYLALTGKEEVPVHVPSVLPSDRRAFSLLYIEWQVIDRILKTFSLQLREDRLELTDLQEIKEWVTSLWTRFRVLKEEIGDDQQHCFQKQFNLFHWSYTYLSDAYPNALKTTPAYHRFPGMLHMVEIMAEDGLPVESYISALSLQLGMIWQSIEIAEREKWDKLIDRCK